MSRSGTARCSGRSWTWPTVTCLISSPSRCTYFSYTCCQLLTFRSHALPIKECLPQTGERYSESRLVDFAINLIPRSVSDDSLSKWLRSQPNNVRTVNQSLYAPLCRHPTIVSVEVKVNGTEEEARVQIGIWLSAWHERVSQTGADEDHRIITLPVIIVLNHYWHLYLAVDKGSHIVRTFRPPAY